MNSNKSYVFCTQSYNWPVDEVDYKGQHIGVKQTQLPP